MHCIITFGSERAPIYVLNESNKIKVPLSDKDPPLIDLCVFLPITDST